MDPITNYELRLLVKRDNRKLRRVLLLLRREKIITEYLSLLRNYKPASLPFLVKVTEKIAPNYFSIVKFPMDLSSIGKFKQPLSLYQFYRLVEQMLDNCDQYNFNDRTGNFSEVYLYGLEMRKYFCLLKTQYQPINFEIFFSHKKLKNYFKRVNKVAKFSQQEILVVNFPMEHLQVVLCKYIKQLGYESIERSALNVLCEYVLYSVEKIKF